MKYIHTFEFRESGGKTHKKSFEYDPATFNVAEEFDKWKSEIENTKVYLCQSKDTLLIHGCFDSKEKALKYSGESQNIAIVPLNVK